MKKYLSLVLVVLMCLTFAACGELSPAEQAVADYVDAHGDEFLDGLEEGFISSSGMTCESTIEAEGTGFVVNVNINGADNIPEANAKQMQAAYDAAQSSFDSMLKQLQSEAPEVTYFEINVCEEDGDVLAVIKAGNK